MVSLNLCLKSETFCLYFILYFHVDPDPQSFWIRIHYGSASSLTVYLGWACPGGSCAWGRSAGCLPGHILENLLLEDPVHEVALLVAYLGISWRIFSWRILCMRSLCSLLTWAYPGGSSPGGSCAWGRSARCHAWPARWRAPRSSSPSTSCPRNQSFYIKAVL